MPYEIIDHTADTGIRVWAENPKRLFEEAAGALFDLIADTGRINETETRQIHTEGIDRTDLLINWLRQLLLLWTGDNCLVVSAQIIDLTETRLEARINVEPFDPEKHEIYADIKAVTYHNAEVNKTNGGWEAAVIFDV